MAEAEFYEVAAEVISQKGTCILGTRLVTNFYRG